jgi:predicted DNA-binding antitoxin AbrB/MazE fold protein
MKPEVATMSTTVKAIYENGVFKPKEPVSLEEHAEVEVVIPTRQPRDPDDPTGWKAIDSLIGILKGTPPDVSENHDAYLYRKPGE